MGLEPNGDWKRMQSAMLIADVTGDWMEGVVVAQLVIENSIARPEFVKGEEKGDNVTVFPKIINLCVTYFVITNYGF